MNERDLPHHTFIFTSVPPSFNELYRTVNGRPIKSKTYRDWEATASVELLTQRGALPNPCYWSARILIPGSCRKDIDNIASKALFDLIGKMHRTPDDRYCVGFSTWFHAEKFIQITIQQEEIDLWTRIKKPAAATLRKLRAAIASPRPN